MLPKRIISVVPSQTELLFDLGLEDEVIGITKFCVHPTTWFRTKQRVGGTKNLNLDLIESLQPDLILANKEENTKEQIEYLQNKFPVYVSDIENFSDALLMIKTIGKKVGKEAEANVIINEINSTLLSIHKPKHKKASLYLIWKDPYMAAGNDTFIHDMMNHAGLQNVVTTSRYPVLSLQQMKALNPEIILLSSEPFPFKEKHIDELKINLPKATILLVDGEMFSWYGSRMKYAFQYFTELNL